ncbi:MAG TPA: cysteine dioxygenase family protein [Thermoanaerobaculia bacterium]|nr:cysteine dioxygenase family protein [Thermoanaerobaculia bacterium]
MEPASPGPCRSAALNHLIDDWRDAVRSGDVDAITRRIKADLAGQIRSEGVDLPPSFRRTDPDHYARRLLYRDPELPLTAVVMAWAPNQATPLHDHSGIWCVEGVVEGEMEVVRYDLLEERGGACRFAEVERLRAGVGSAGALIPPLEYHVLRNPTEETVITLHVYGGEMDHCGVFEPQGDGSWRREERALSYHD